MYATEVIARVCHEANRALQLEQGDPRIPLSADWDHLDEETRASAIAGVQGVRAGSTPEESHEGWCRFKREHGWRWGPVKDEERKEHPLLVPYGQLDAAAKVKDDLFVAIVQALS